MKTILRLAAAGLLLLLTSAAWCQVLQTKITIQPGAGWGCGAITQHISGGANEFTFSVAAGRAHRSANPQVTIRFASDAWNGTPACSAPGWTVDHVSTSELHIRWTGKPRAGDVITASITCSDE
jgi:hypothetical protein